MNKPSSRLRACLSVSALVHLGLVGTLLTKAYVAPVPVVEATSPVVIDLELGAPPEPLIEVAAKPVASQPSPSEPQPQQPVPKAVARPETARLPFVEVATPRPSVTPPSTERPPSVAVPPSATSVASQAPPAPRATRTQPANWRSQVMAQLERHRRYPVSAQRRGLEGTAMVRFSMSRDGQVLSSRLERSSGHAELDRAAIETPRRAQPFPSIPSDQTAPMDLVVAVEFFQS